MSGQCKLPGCRDTSGLIHHSASDWEKAFFEAGDCARQHEDNAHNWRTVAERAEAQLAASRQREGRLREAMRYAKDALNTHGGPPLHSGCLSGNPCKRCAFDDLTAALADAAPVE